jgi:hypothetical protein
LKTDEDDEDDDELNIFFGWAVAAALCTTAEYGLVRRFSEVRDGMVLRSMLLPRSLFVVLHNPKECSLLYNA